MRTEKPSKRTRGRFPGLLVAALIGVALMGGCLVEQDQAATDEAMPQAVLQPSSFVVWDGETVYFNGTGSQDANGKIAEWRFDFGDGSKMSVDDASEANVSHEYGSGGEFTVSLTVIDDGANQTGVKTHTATTTVVVNETYTVETQVIYAAPTNGSGQAGEYSAQFAAHEGVDSAQIELGVRSLLVAGTAQVTISFVSPDNDTLVEESVEVAAQSNQTVLVEVPDADAAGDYTLRVTADSGGAEISGEVAYLYDEEYPPTPT